MRLPIIVARAPKARMRHISCHHRSGGGQRRECRRRRAATARRGARRGCPRRCLRRLQHARPRRATRRGRHPGRPVCGIADICNHDLLMPELEPASSSATLRCRCTPQGRRPVCARQQQVRRGLGLATACCASGRHAGMCESRHAEDKLILRQIASLCCGRDA
eukprot:363267-Chlamydomonas_euryale.AAC.22